MVGMMIHMMFSAIVAFIYAWIFEALWPNATWWSGLVLGIGHWLLGGLMLPVLDKMNGGAKRGEIPAIEAIAKGYGGLPSSPFSPAT